MNMNMTPSDAKPPNPPFREPMLEVRQLRVKFGDRHILRGVDFQLWPGETVIVLGGSGCGKSTLLSALIGAVTPHEGEIFLFGKNVAEMSEAERDRYRTRLGMLFQSGALFNSMTVGENLAFVLREHTELDENEVGILVRMKLEMVGMRHAEDLFPSEISGGMKKRAALARALCLDPKVMLYDEPGAGLDPVTLAGVDRCIGTLGRVLNMASLVVTHRIKSAMGIADRMIYLHEGQILAEGPPESIRDHEDARIQQFLRGEADGPLTEKGLDDDYGHSLLGTELQA